MTLLKLLLYYIQIFSLKNDSQSSNNLSESSLCATHNLLLRHNVFLGTDSLLVVINCIQMQLLKLSISI